MLAALRTYKYILAAFLLAVYGFIAAPVQLWHQHHYISNATQGTVSSATKSDTVSQSAHSSPEANCPVCSHKYSTYIDDAIIPFEASLIVHTAKNGVYSLPFVSACSFLLPNKGPPVLS
jgi:hypothetical protein